MAAPLPTSHPDPSAAVMRIALQVGATPVAHVDIGTLLSGVCSALSIRGGRRRGRAGAHLSPPTRTTRRAGRSSPRTTRRTASA